MLAGTNSYFLAKPPTAQLGLETLLGALGNIRRRCRSKKIREKGRLRRALSRSKYLRDRSLDNTLLRAYSSSRNKFPATSTAQKDFEERELGGGLHAIDYKRSKDGIPIHSSPPLPAGNSPFSSMR